MNALLSNSNVLVTRKLKMCLVINSTGGEWGKFTHMKVKLTLKTLFYNFFHSVTICSKPVSVDITLEVRKITRSSNIKMSDMK